MLQEETTSRKASFSYAPLLKQQQSPKQVSVTRFSSVGLSPSSSVPMMDPASSYTRLIDESASRKVARFIGHFAPPPFARPRLSRSFFVRSSLICRLLSRLSSCGALLRLVWMEFRRDVCTPASVCRNFAIHAALK